MSLRRYAFPGTNTLCEKMGIRPVSIGRQTMHGMEGVHWRRTLPFYQMVILLRGENFYETSLTRERVLAAPAAFFTFPGIWHRYGTYKGKSARTFYFRFDGNIPRRYYDDHLLNPSQPVIVIRNAARIETLCNDVWHALGRPNDRYMEYASQGILQILQELLIQHGPVLSRTEDREITHIVRMMRKQIGELYFDFRTYCTANNVGFENMRKIFKQRTGYPPQQYFLRMKLAAAKEQLLSTDHSIKSIARAVGFTDQYYFSRLFKQHENMSPAYYRNECAGQNDDEGR
ncbi:MAG: helix-turn-helix transcriptional regulator [Spirochaetes bacterium]|nr:helix-turn-helix transcriptional regulator [Spirochaetota bacterium]